MPIGTSHNTGGTRDGIFFETINITRVQPYYNSSPDYMSSPVDIGLQVFWEVDTGSQQFETSLFMVCYFDKADNGVIRGVKGGFKVDRLFEKAGLEAPDLDEDMQIPEDSLAELVGQQVRVLKYRNIKSTADKLKTSTWDYVGDPDGTEDDYIREYFLEQVAKGYPRNYLPSLATNGSEASNTNGVSQEEINKVPF